jgi:hypothetical protein
MSILKLAVAGEEPAVWHVVVVRDVPPAGALPPIQSMLATESEMRKAVEQMRRSAMQ